MIFCVSFNRSCNIKLNLFFRDLESTIENIWLHIKKSIEERIKEAGQAPMDPTAEIALKTQILQIAKSDSPVRSLLCKLRFFYFSCKSYRRVFIINII